MSQIAEIIAGQLHHTKPDAWVPGKDVGFKAHTEGGMEGLRFIVMPRKVHGRVMYDRPSDTYIVTITEPDGEVVTYHDVYFDQLGPLVWGADCAKPYLLPSVIISDFDGGNAEVIA